MKKTLLYYFYIDKNDYYCTDIHLSCLSYYSDIFDEVKLGDLKLKSRIVRTGTWETETEEGGFLTPIKFFITVGIRSPNQPPKRVPQNMVEIPQ